MYIYLHGMHKIQMVHVQHITYVALLHKIYNMAMSVKRAMNNSFYDNQIIICWSQKKGKNIYVCKNMCYLRIGLVTMVIGTL